MAGPRATAGRSDDDSAVEPIELTRRKSRRKGGALRDAPPFLFAGGARLSVTLTAMPAGVGGATREGSARFPTSAHALLFFAAGFSETVTTVLSWPERRRALELGPGVAIRAPGTCGSIDGGTGCDRISSGRSLDRRDVHASRSSQWPRVQVRARWRQKPHRVNPSPAHWVNRCMARYYGIGRIAGESGPARRGTSP